MRPHRISGPVGSGLGLLDLDYLYGKPQREEVSCGALAYETSDGRSLCAVATHTHPHPAGRVAGYHGERVGLPRRALMGIPRTLIVIPLAIRE